MLFGALQSFDIWESIEEALIIRNDGGDAGLLQHDLRNPDAIRIVCAAPGQVALVLPIPVQNAAANGSARSEWKCIHRPSINGLRSDALIGFRAVLGAILDSIIVRRGGIEIGI